MTGCSLSVEEALTGCSLPAKALKGRLLSAEGVLSDCSLSLKGA